MSRLSELGNFLKQSAKIWPTLGRTFGNQLWENLARKLRILQTILLWSGAEVRKSCRSQKQSRENKYLLASISFDGVEDEPSEGI